VTDQPPVNQPGLSASHLVRLTGVLAAGLVVVALLCSLFGQVGLSWNTFAARMLRLIAAATVGASLAAAGMALQGLLRNPLAEPYILGISSGAGVGVLLGLAVAAEVALPSWAMTPVMALVGAAATCGVVYSIAQRRGRLDPYVLLLSGVIVNAFNGAIMLSIFLLVPPRTIARFAVWAMGGVSEALAITNTPLLAGCAVAAIACWAALVVRGAALNALGLGDEVAGSVGVPVHRLRVEVFALVSVMTAAAVMLAGPIGFLGLIVPHICRLAVGPDHRKLAIVSGFGGAILLMIADTFCRLAGGWLKIGEVPVGIVTALCGGPFFIYLLRTRLAEGRS